MAPTKHRDDQVFTADVTFKDVVIHEGVVTNKGAVTNEGTVTNEGAVTNKVTVTHEGAVTHEVTVTHEGGVVRTGRQLFIPAADALAGATAGWLVTGADDGLARLPAAETSSTLVIPLKGLHIGDKLTGVAITGQVESAGANATLALDVRKGTATVADITDASLGTAASGTLTADTLITSAGTPVAVSSLTEVIAEGESVYALITGTTAALTDIAVSGLLITYDQA